MDNFYFYNPTKVIFGRNSIPRIRNEISQDSRILMVYGGGSIKKNKIYDQVISALRNYELYEFQGVEPNPEYETCKKLIREIRKKDIDFFYWQSAAGLSLTPLSLLHWPITLTKILGTY